MKFLRIVILQVAILLLFSTAADLWARKRAEMPDDFGTAVWAASNWEEAVKYLRYVTDRDTRERMLKVDKASRAVVWDELWQGYDSERVAEANEFRDRYFERVRHANENYGTILQYGWETDRGETWIRLGPPRWQDRYNMRGPGRDIEVWQYWAPKAVDLVFIDRTGVGDFYLLNPYDMIDRAYLYAER